MNIHYVVRRATAPRVEYAVRWSLYGMTVASSPEKRFKQVAPTAHKLERAPSLPPSTPPFSLLAQVNPQAAKLALASSSFRSTSPPGFPACIAERRESIAHPRGEWTCWETLPCQAFQTRYQVRKNATCSTRCAIRAVPCAVASPRPLSEALPDLGGNVPATTSAVTSRFFSRFY